MKAARPDPATSERMAGVRQKGTRLEDLAAIQFRQLGLAYRRNVKGLPGSPDFSNRKRRWAIFVNGCFWHHHRGCKHATIPRANAAFWVDKFKRNRSRDAEKIVALRKMGFQVVVLWGCRLRDPTYVSRAVSKVLKSSGVGVT